MGISLLLLTDERPLGYVTAVVAPVLMVVSVWFWWTSTRNCDQPLAPFAADGVSGGGSSAASVISLR